VLAGRDRAGEDAAVGKEGNGLPPGARPVFRAEQVPDLYYRSNAPGADFEEADPADAEEDFERCRAEFHQCSGLRLYLAAVPLLTACPLS
jgi:hypothetical protein